jgi:hypothetical protein
METTKRRIYIERANGDSLASSINRILRYYGKMQTVPAEELTKVVRASVTRAIENALIVVRDENKISAVG